MKKSILLDIEILFLRELDTMAREISMFPNDEMIWHAPAGITNSAGTLVQHVCGNLRHYIGAVLGQTGYLRNRTAEFSECSSSREALIREIAETKSDVRKVLSALDGKTLPKTYPENVGGFSQRTQRFVLHLCTHLSLHVGQVGYLRRLMTEENITSGPVSVKFLADA